MQPTNATTNVLVDAFVSIVAKTREGVTWDICHKAGERERERERKGVGNRLEIAKEKQEGFP